MSESDVDLTLLQASLAQSRNCNAQLQAQAARASIGSRSAMPTKPATDARIPKPEGMMDLLKLLPSFPLAALALTLTVMVALLGYVATQIAAVERRVESINRRLSAKFQAMRTDMNAQTTAFVNAITTTRQAPPQILLIPAPETPPKPPQ